jgi:hypothetical protein
LAALLFLKGYPKIYKQRETETDFSVNKSGYDIVPLEISSYNGIIKAEVKVIDGINGILWSKVPILVPLKIKKVNFDLVCLNLTKEGTVVEFPGITHVVFKDIALGKNILCCSETVKNDGC